MTLRRPTGTPLLVACASPLVGFPLLWLLAVGLAQIHVLSVQTPWSGTAWMTILLVPVMFLVGGGGAMWVVRWRGPATGERTALQTRRWTLVALVVVGYAELAREFALAGAVPLLSHHIDQTRVDIHPGALGLLVDALTVSAIVAITAPARLFDRAARPELIIAILSVGGFGLSGGRQAIAVAGAGLIARLLFWGTPRLRATVLVALAGLALFGLVFWVRTGQELPQSFTQELYGSVVHDTFKPAIPLLPAFFALAMNPVVLAKVIAYFPHTMPYGHGSYDAGAIHSLVHATDLGAVTQKLSSPWIVSTAAGPLWADDGLLAVLIGFLVIGAITTTPYALYQRTHRFPHVVLAGYFVSLALFCVYQDLMTSYKDWVFVAIGLYLVGRRVELPQTEQPAAEAPQPPQTLRSPLMLAGVVVTVGLLVLEIAIADHYVARLRALQGLPADATQPHLIASGVYDIPLTVPAQARPLLRDTLESGPSGSPQLWAFSHGHGAVRVTPVSDDATRLSVGQTLVLPDSFPRRGATYSVAPWGPRRKPAAFALVSRGDSVSVTVATLDGPPRIVLRAASPAVPRIPGGRRTVAVAVANADDPDLFVVDRDAAGHITVTAISGVSGFRRVVYTRRPNLTSLVPPRSWQVAIGAIQSSTADLLFLGSGSRAPGVQLEAHVLLGSAAFRAFGDQTKLGLDADLTRARRFVIASTPPSAAVFDINPKRGTVNELEFG